MDGIAIAAPVAGTTTIPTTNRIMTMGAIMMADRRL